MERMNLFGGNDKSSKASFENNTPKENTNQLPPAPIQDDEGNLTFSLEDHEYSLNVNSEEEREVVKEEINSNTLAKYNWFREESGKRHWVLYNTEMYEVKETLTHDKYIHYKENSNLNPVIPVNATSCYYMFYGCYKLNQLDLSNFDTSNITDMCGMFKECKSLSQLDLSNFGTSQVTDMCGMFSGCIALAQLDLSNFDTSSATDMSHMFCDCSKLTSLDLSNFDTSKVTTMSHMFTNCYNVKQLDLSNFDTSNVFDMSAMFFKCFSLTQLDLSAFNNSMVEYMK